MNNAAVFIYIKYKLSCNLKLFVFFSEAEFLFMCSEKDLPQLYVLKKIWVSGTLYTVNKG